MGVWDTGLIYLFYWQSASFLKSNFTCCSKLEPSLTYIRSYPPAPTPYIGQLYLPQCHPWTPMTYVERWSGTDASNSRSKCQTFFPLMTKMVGKKWTLCVCDAWTKNWSNSRLSHLQTAHAMPQPCPMVFFTKEFKKKREWL